MRMSISTMSGLSRPAAATASSPSPASPTTVKLGFGLEDLAQPDANERLVVGDENRRHRIGSTTRTAKPPLGPRLASKRPP